MVVDFDDTLSINGRPVHLSEIKAYIAGEAEARGAIPVISIEPHWRSMRQAVSSVARAVNETGAIPFCLAAN